MTTARIGVLGGLVGAAVLAVLAFAVAYLLGHDSSPSTSSLPTAAPSTPGPELTAAPSASAEPTATSTPTPPAPSATLTPTPGASTPGPTTSPRSYPFATPTTSYPPLTITTTMKPATAGTTQTAYVLSVRLRDGDGAGSVTSVDWGDGTSWKHEPVGMVTCAIYPSPTAPPAPYSPHPSDTTVAIHHAWRTPGPYTVKVQASSSGPRCRPDSAAFEDASRSFSVQVGPDATLTSNGPAAPGFLKATAARDRAHRHLDVSGDSADSDGFVNRVEVDWGDGSTHGVFTRPLSDCSDHSGATYPNDQSWAVHPVFSHTYKKAGTYVVKVTVSSVGCDGADQQQAVSKGSISF
ncbi:MAG: hypothetical protein QOK42_313 [Frankiaceae bacterium]|nr:hypothetical protein [Frankiaceae bacterium]